jgi:F-type H+-transporting ATPase subunit delta
MTGSIARRYAKAIIAIAQEQQSLEPTGTELQLLGTLAADPEIASGLANPLLSATARRGLAGSIAASLKLGPTMRNFLCLLADHRRLDQLPGIAEQYRRQLDQMLGRVRATITSAVPLSPDELQAVIGAFERKAGRTVLAEHHVDPQLLGGLVVDIDGTIHDGSLRTQLQTLATHIAGGRSLL